MRANSQEVFDLPAAFRWEAGEKIRRLPAEIFGPHQPGDDTNSIAYHLKHILKYSGNPVELDEAAFWTRTAITKLLQPQTPEGATRFDSYDISCGIAARGLLALAELYEKMGKDSATDRGQETGEGLSMRTLSDQGYIREKAHLTAEEIIKWVFHHETTLTDENTQKLVFEILEYYIIHRSRFLGVSRENGVIFTEGKITMRLKVHNPGKGYLDMLERAAQEAAEKCSRFSFGKILIQIVDDQGQDYGEPLDGLRSTNQVSLDLTQAIERHRKEMLESETRILSTLFTCWRDPHDPSQAWETVLETLGEGQRELFLEILKKRGSRVVISQSPHYFTPIQVTFDDDGKVLTTEPVLEESE